MPSRADNSAAKKAAKPAATAAEVPAATAEKGTAPAKRGGANAQSQFAQTFAQAVAVLMRSPGHRSVPIGALEWLLLPPLLVGQCRIAHAKPTKDSAAFAPMGLAVWARVSPAVDKRLSENLDKPLQLQPGEWTSGNIPWLIMTAGDPKVLPNFIRQLQKTEFPGKEVKLRVNDKDGKVVIRTLKGDVAQPQVPG
mgnify:CR=1 FL=1